MTTPSFPDHWFIEELLTQADQLGCPLRRRQAEAYLRYTRLLLHWNQKINLTRITAPKELLAKHLLDSILPARWLPSQGPALDIGSGAGFPGIPLQIFLPELKFVLLEGLRKKASFLKVSLAELKLSNAQAAEARWQDFARSGIFGPASGFQLITMRALKPTKPLMATIADTLLAAGGRFAFWAGPDVCRQETRNLAAQGSGLQIAGVHAYRLPYHCGRRHLVVWEKRGR